MIDKVAGQIGPLIDLVGIDHINQMIALEQLEVVPMAMMRGRSFNNSLIIVNEAQNLTEDHIKLLLGRVGENSRILFDYDYKQSDSNLFRNKSGVKMLLNLSESPVYSKMFAAVKLNTTVRSKTACAADYLDNLCGNI